MKIRLARKIYHFIFLENKMSVFDASFCVKPYNKGQIKKAISRLNKWKELEALATLRYEFHFFDDFLCPKVNKRVRFIYSMKK